MFFLHISYYDTAVFLFDNSEYKFKLTMIGSSSVLSDEKIVSMEFLRISPSLQERLLASNNPEDEVQGSGIYFGFV